MPTAAPSPATWPCVCSRASGIRCATCKFNADNEQLERAFELKKKLEPNPIEKPKRVHTKLPKGCGKCVECFKGGFSQEMVDGPAVLTDRALAELAYHQRRPRPTFLDVYRDRASRHVDLLLQGCRPIPIVPPATNELWESRMDTMAERRRVAVEEAPEPGELTPSELPVRRDSDRRDRSDRGDRESGRRRDSGRRDSGRRRDQGDRGDRGDRDSGRRRGRDQGDRGDRDSGRPSAKRGPSPARRAESPPPAKRARRAKTPPPAKRDRYGPLFLSRIIIPSASEVDMSIVREPVHFVAVLKPPAWYVVKDAEVILRELRAADLAKLGLTRRLVRESRTARVRAHVATLVKSMAAAQAGRKADEAAAKAAAKAEAAARTAEAERVQKERLEEGVRLEQCEDWVHRFMSTRTARTAVA